MLLLSTAVCLVCPSTAGGEPAGSPFRWAIGGMLMGPALNLAVDGQLFVGDWLVVQAGMPLPRMQIGGHAGLRLRPLEVGSFRPFAGAFVNGYWFEYESEPTHAWGLRLGLDWEFADGMGVLGVEVNAVRPFDPESWNVLGLSGQWVPWAGLSLSARSPP